MLDELAPVLVNDKGKGLLGRLNKDKDENQALPAEMELALLWALNSLGDLEIEPEWWGDSKRPDAITDYLVPGTTAAIEIAATSDNSLSGEADMNAIALQISETANRAQSGTGDYLYFHFGETSGYEAGRYFRHRLAPKGFKIDDAMRAAIADWINSASSSNVRLHLQGRGLDVQVERKTYKQKRYHNIFSSMPVEAHSVDDNPLCDLLRRKKRQLKAAAQGTIRLLFLADVGSSLLNRIGKSGWRDPAGRTFSGADIIDHFVRIYSADIDGVVVFSPTIERPAWFGRDLFGRHPKRWTVTFFGTKQLPQPPIGLERLASILPAPHYEGYQARSLFLQGSFATQGRGQYLEVIVKGNSKDNRQSISFPARLLVDLLAGRISEEWFRNYHTSGGRKTNPFKDCLNMGMTLSGAEISSRNLDEDDDHIILHFSDDPAARPFKLKHDGS